MGSRQQLAKSFDFCSVDLPMRGGCFCGRNGFLGQFRRSAQERSQSHHGFRLYRRMRDGDVGLSQRETRRKLENDGHLRHRDSRCRSSNEGLVCHVRRCRKQCGHWLLSTLKANLSVILPLLLRVAVHFRGPPQSSPQPDESRTGPLSHRDVSTLIGLRGSGPWLRG